jgi:RNA methyltransferase, TrmH family
VLLSENTCLHPFQVITTAEIKLIKSLHQKKFREETGLFIVEGEKLVRELLQSDWTIDRICATSAWLENNKIPKKIQFNEVRNAELERISALSTPNEVLAVVGQREYSFSSSLAQSGLTLILDDIRDPGNLGTIIRIADWFGVKQIICSTGSVELFNPKTVQSTMGSIFRMPVSYADPVDVMMKLKEINIPICGAAMDGQDATTYSWKKAMALVMGSESHGIRPATDRFLDERINIPKFGNAESLNVSVATGILCSLYQMK